jgi:hypothetical protein
LRRSSETDQLKGVTVTADDGRKTERAAAVIIADIERRMRPRAAPIEFAQFVTLKLIEKARWVARRSGARWVAQSVARRPVVWVPLAALAAAGLLALPLGPVSWWATPTKNLQGKDKADVRNATRQIVLAAVGGMVLLTGAAFTARTFFLSRRAHFTDRYTKAIGQIASDKLTERLGGIYALEHLMNESEQDHNTVVEVLAALVRELTRTSARTDSGDDAIDPRPTTDVQAALTVLGRRPPRREPNPVDLRGADLRGADMTAARLDRALLSRALLQKAVLVAADLERADLREAQLQHAVLSHAVLRRAHLDEAQMQGGVPSRSSARGGVHGRGTGADAQPAGRCSCRRVHGTA